MFAAALASGNFHDGDHELGARPTFELAMLRDLDGAQQHPLQLAGSFGDGALLNQFAPYRRMREALHAAGYRFVPMEDLSHGERIAPELRLLDSLRRRYLPYRRMGLAFDDMLTSAPRALFDDVGITRICSSNTTPHEGAHAIVYETTLAAEGPLSPRRVAEALVTGEGFAMAFEFWLALLLMNHERRSTAIFFAFNVAQNPFSLGGLEADSPGVLARLGQLAVTKPAAVLRMFAAAGLVANVRPKARAVREELVRFLADYAGLGPEDTGEANALVRAALSLDDGFRTVTARTFFRFCELEDAYRELCALPLEYHFEKGSVLREHVPAAIAMVLGDDRQS